MIRRPLGVILLAWLALHAGDAARVQFIRPPRIATDRDLVTLQVRVAPHPEHRRLIVAALDGDLTVRRSDEPLDGADAPRTRWLRWYLPAGDLRLVAAVFDQSRELDRDVARIRVLATGP